MPQIYEKIKTIGDAYGAEQRICDIWRVTGNLFPLLTDYN
jgi:hypothetical protein